MPTGQATLIERLRRVLFELYRRAPQPARSLVVRLIAPTYTAGAAVVLRRVDGAILLVEQRHTGAWALPGGLMSRGETPERAAIREVDEEVGIAIDPSELGVPRALLDPRRRAIDLVFVVSHPDGRGARRNDPVEVKRFGWYDEAGCPPLTEPTAAILAQLRREP